MDLIEVERMRVATSRADLALAPGEAVLAGGTWLFSEPQPGLRGHADIQPGQQSRRQFEHSRLLVKASLTHRCVVLRLC